MGTCCSKPEPEYPLTAEYPPISGNLRPNANPPHVETHINSDPDPVRPDAPPNAPIVTNNADLVIGIDFGTTFTGVAYAHTAGIGPATSTAEMRKAADKVSVIKTWPSKNNYYAEKTPTILAYNKRPPLWGGNVKPTDDPQVAHFKLGLQEGIITHYQDHSASAVIKDYSILGGYLSDHNWRHPELPEMRAVDYAGDYLTRIIQYVTQEVLPSRYGERFLQNQKISYVLTVPAIWSDKAKQQTRQAAFASGIEQDDLTLITEPEAAALYCATLCEQVDLEPGDRFMICDAGGGTVDLISYKVLTSRPFRVEECSVGTGAACGAIYLDQGFENLLRKRFEGVGVQLLDERRLGDLLRQFDSSIKRQFNPYDSQAETDFEVSVAGIQDMPQIGLRDGYLMLSKNDIQGVFDPIFGQVLRLIKDQMDTVRDMYGERMKTLFLVGGLGSSHYLMKFLQARLRGVLTVKQPEAGYSAIMRGAVLYKLGLDFVKDRVTRVSYGTVMRVPFREGYHPQFRKEVDFDGLARCSGVMHWFVKKGVSMTSGTMLEHDFYSDRSIARNNASVSYQSTNELWICEDDNPPEYSDETRLKLHVRLTVDLLKLPSDAWEKRRGVLGEYRRFRYQLGLCFGAGGIEWRFLHKGNVIGSVDCQYI